MKKELLIKECLNCSREFKTTRVDKTYCQTACKIEAISFRNGDRQSKRYEKYVHRNIKDSLPLPEMLFTL